MIRPMAGRLPRRRQRQHCRRLVGQVEDSGHVMGHAARDPNSVEFQAVEVREILDRNVQALVKVEVRRKILLVVEMESLRKTLLVVELAMLKPEVLGKLETTNA